MRPVLISSSFAPHLGGVEEVVRQLSRQLLARGQAPTVVTNRWPKDLPDEETVAGVSVLRVPFSVPEPRPMHLAGWLLHSAQTHRRLQRRGRDAAWDLINVQCVSSNGRYALSLAEVLDLPLVVSLHGELTADVNQVYSHSAHLRRTWRRLLKRADVVTAPSRRSLELAEEAFGEAFGGRGHVIRNGVDLELFRPDERTDQPPVLLAVGRLVGVKGFDVLISAFAELRAVLPEQRLVIVGDGPERQALKALAAQVAPGAVHFTGFLDSEQVADHMRSASTYVLASREEAFGLTLLEAMAVGLPVVATRVGGVPEVVEDEVTGLLVPPDDAHALFRAILRSLTHHDDTQRRVAAARAQVQRMSWEACSDAYEAAFVEARARHASTRLA